MTDQSDRVGSGLKVGIFSILGDWLGSASIIPRGLNFGAVLWNWMGNGYPLADLVLPGGPEGGRSVSAAPPQPTEQAYIRHPIKSFDIRIIAILVLIIYNRLDARCKLAPWVAGWFR